ncbi:MAG: ABC transporter permease [Gemmataceae bacterium]
MKPSALLAAGPLAFLLLFLAGPLALLLRVSLYAPAWGRGFYQPGSWSLESFGEIARDPTLRQVAGFTLALGLLVTALTLALAYPLALFIHSLPDRVRRLAIACGLLPKLCNVLVLIFGLQLLLSGAGPISQALLGLGLTREPVLLYRNLAGAVIGEVYLLLPYAVLLILVGLARIDPELLAAARGLGASPWQVFWRVTWPLSWPGVLAAAQLALVWALAAVLGPLLLGGPEQTTLGVEIQRQALEYHRWPRAAALAVLLLVLLTLVLALLTRAQRTSEG